MTSSDFDPLTYFRPLHEPILRAGAHAMRSRGQSFAAATGVSNNERRRERSAIRKAAGLGAAERAYVRFGKVVDAFKRAEGRSPGADDAEVWKAFAQIVREELGQ